MNPLVWWMVDVGLSHALEDCPQSQAQKKCLYLEAHVSNGLSSALSAEIKDEFDTNFEYVLVEICDSLIASENDELKRENEMLKMELSRLKGKDHV
jgi:hypothetical protein